MSLDRPEFARCMTDMIAAVSNGDKEYAREINRRLVDQILSSPSREYWFRRLADEYMMMWFDTYKKNGRGPWVPRNAARPV